MSLSREHLEALDKEALIEIILQLAARVSQLEARLNQNSKNSSKPPSSDPPFGSGTSPKNKKQGNKNKSGGQPGHEGYGLKKVPVPDRVQEHLPLKCFHCGYSLEQEVATPAGCWQVFDLPQDIKIEVVEHRCFARRCPWCNGQNRGDLPGWLSEGTPCQWGPRCRALAVYLMSQQHLPYARTQALFADLFGSVPSEGTLFCWQRQAYERLEPVESAIAEARWCNASRSGPTRRPHAARVGCTAWSMSTTPGMVPIPSGVEKPWSALAFCPALLAC
jgi:hypothetical protein